MVRELLLGCGTARLKKLSQEGLSKTWDQLTTLDMSPEVGADVVHDLEKLPYPFPDSSFDEIHAYDVLEHQGRQGDWRFFFDQFTEFARILKLDGYLFGISPHWFSNWAWGDPGHTRIINAEQLSYLDRSTYVKNQELGSPMTNYLWYWKGNFKLEAYELVQGQAHYMLKLTRKPK